MVPGFFKLIFWQFIFKFGFPENSFAVLTIIVIMVSSTSKWLIGWHISDPIRQPRKWDVRTPET